MFDEEKYEVHPSIAQAMPQAAEQELQPEQQLAQETQTQQQEQKPAEPSVHEINYRALREKEKRLERERDEALKLAQDLQQRYQQSPVQKNDDVDDISIGSDDIVEGKHLSKVQKELKRLKEELNQYKQQSSVHTAEARLKAQYPDFDKVVTKDNVELLKSAYPELAATLQASGDMYNVGASAYTLIKKFNIDQSHTYEAEQAQRNIAKPKPVNAISPQQGDNPLTRANAFANGLTEDLKAQLLKEMNQYRKDF